MAYYSFYRIIKDIIRIIFGKRFLRYLLIFFIIFFIYYALFIPKSSASFDFTHNGNEVSIPDLPSNPFNNNDYILYFIPNNYTVLYVSDPTLVYYNNGQIYGQIGLSYYKYMLISNSWVLAVNNATVTAPNNSLIMNTNNVDNLILTTYDIKDLNGNIIFQGPVNYIHPFISTPISQIQDLSFNNLYIEIGDWDISTPLYLHTLEINNTVTDDNNTIYYYTDHIFLLNDNSPYYTQLFDSEKYYFSIPKAKFNFQTNTKYLLVLNDDSESYNNSIGLIEQDIESNIFDSVLLDTTGYLTSNDVINNTLTNIDDNLNDDNISPDTETEIDNVFDYDNSNETLVNNHNGFFSRLMTIFSSMYDYNLNSDTIINIPIPHSNKYITLHSNIISSHIVDPLRSIISAFWMYVFYLYGWKFLNYMLIQIQEGKILDDENPDNIPGTLSANIF